MADIDDAAVKADLLGRFPKRIELLPVAEEFEPFRSLSVDMKDQCRKLHQCSAADLQGLRDEHMKCLAKTFPTGSEANGAMARLQWLANKLVNGELPPWYHALLGWQIAVPIAKLVRWASVGRLRWAAAFAVLPGPRSCATRSPPSRGPAGRTTLGLLSMALLP